MVVIDTSPIFATTNNSSPPNHLTSVKLHNLPFEIDYDGPANVDSFFVVSNIHDSIPSQGSHFEERKDEDNDVETSKAEQTMMSNTESTKFESTFRGRMLRGRLTDIPNGYTGIVMSETKKRTSNKSSSDLDGLGLNDNGTQRTWNNAFQFDNFIVWEHDSFPSDKDNVILKGLEWIQVAHDIHSTL